MPLAERLDFQDQIADAPPVNLSLGAIDIPGDVELTFIGSAHDIRYSNIDYLEGMIRSSDVFMPELTGWTPEDLKQLQAIAKGSRNDLRIALNELQINDQSSQTDSTDQTAESLWTESFLRALYAAKTRTSRGPAVRLPDYPYSHPEASLGQYTVNINKVAMAAINEGSEHGVDLKKIVKRDEFIGRQLCKDIIDLRKDQEHIRRRSPLKVLMLYGTFHYAVAEALQLAALDAGIDTFKVKILFENMQNNIRLPEESFQIRQDASRRFISDFQNWLRTPIENEELAK